MKRFVSTDDPLSVSRDHLLPKSKGGESSVRNYLLAHRKCNSRRGTQIPEGKIQSFRQKALNKLRLSPHWVEVYHDHGMYRGKLPPPDKWAESKTEINTKELSNNGS